MRILIKPIVTEKMSKQGDKLNKYGFIVDRKANKLQIKEAIQEFYGVTVTSVSTMNYDGKSSTKFTKTGILSGNKNSFKKAVISLSKGEKIDFYSNI